MIHRILKAQYKLNKFIRISLQFNYNSMELTFIDKKSVTDKLRFNGF